MAPPIALPKTAPPQAVTPAGVETPKNAPGEAPSVLPPLPPAQRETQWASPALPKARGAAASIEGQPGFSDVPAADRDKLRALFANASSAERVAIADLLRSPGFGVATPEQKTQIVAITCALVGVQYDTEFKAQGARPALPLAALALCLEETVHGVPRLLSNDAYGSTALDHLQRLSTAALHPAVAARLAPETSQQVLAGLVQEIADPRRINQGNGGTCTVTSVQSLMALKIPSEYARITVGLALDGVVPLASGKPMRVNTNGIERMGPHTTRTASERIFQGTVMEWAGTASGHYVAKDEGVAFFQSEGAALWSLPLAQMLLCFLLFPLAIIYGAKRTTKIGNGLSATETRDAAAALMGEPYSVVETRGALVKHLERLRADLQFESEATCIGFSRFDGAPHMLVLVRVDRTCTPPALIMRNPWGSDNQKGKGDAVSGVPETTYEDPNAGLIRMVLTPENEAAALLVVAPSRLV